MLKLLTRFCLTIITSKCSPCVNKTNLHFWRKKLTLPSWQKLKLRCVSNYGSFSNSYFFILLIFTFPEQKLDWQWTKPLRSAFTDHRQAGSKNHLVTCVFWFLWGLLRIRFFFFFNSLLEKQLFWPNVKFHSFEFKIHCKKSLKYNK